MKIVQINTFPYKATGSIMMNIHNQLCINQEESFVIWGRGRQPQNETEISIEDKWGIQIHGAYTRLLDLTGFASWRATYLLIDKLKEIQPDVVHLHNLHGYYLNIDILFTYLKQSGSKVVWTLHDCWSFTGHCAYFDWIHCNKWKRECSHCPQKHTYPASVGLDQSKWNYKHKKELFCKANMTIVSPCEWLAKLVKQSFLQEYQVKVIHNGVDFNVFQENTQQSDIRDRYNIGAKCLVLGVASEWTERKGMKDFIELGRRLNPDLYQIMMIGLTKEQVKEVEEQNSTHNIIALERTENVEALVESYCAADIFWNPTYEDNYPTTNLEALACGTPVCTYQTGGSVESISKETGYIVEKGDIQGFLHWLQTRYESKYERKLGIVIDHEQLRKLYDKEIMISQYIELYRSLCS